MGIRPPGLAIYWADSLKPLTNREMKDMRGAAVLVDITPHEVLFTVDDGEHRKVAVVSITDEKGQQILRKAKLLP